MLPKLPMNTMNAAMEIAENAGRRINISRRSFLGGLMVVALNCSRGADGGRKFTEAGEWRDCETGRRVRRVTPPSLPAAGLYHHMRAFTTDGRWMLFSARTKSGMNVHALDLRDGAIHCLTRDGRARLICAVPGRSEALVIAEGAYQLLNIPDGSLRRVAEVPPDQTFATAPDVTADGKQLVATRIEMTDEARKISRSEKLWVSRVWRLHLKNILFTLDLQTGERKEFCQLNDWVDHLQCSPTDPTLFNYVDQGGAILDSGNSVRVMRTDGTGRETVAVGGGHHIWSPDGHHIYYNDEAGHAAPWEYWRWDRRTGRREHLLPREEWNYHFCGSLDGRLLVGDGTAANPYINLYHLEGGGNFWKERLCHRIATNMRSENQARFAPDGKSVFFNGDVEGIPAIFRVLI